MKPKTLQELLSEIDNIGASEIAAFACNGDPSNKHEFEVIELLDAYAMSLEKTDKAKASLNRANEVGQGDDSGSPSVYEQVIKLKLHEWLHIEHVHIFRVVGGWIYNFTFATSESRDLEAFENHVFVPEPKMMVMTEQMERPSYTLKPAWSEDEYALASEIWNIFKKNLGTDGKKMTVAIIRDFIKRDGGN